MSAEWWDLEVDLFFISLLDPAGAFKWDLGKGGNQGFPARGLPNTKLGGNTITAIG